jgi:hypothetical protein
MAHASKSMGFLARFVFDYPHSTKELLRINSQNPSGVYMIASTIMTLRVCTCAF